MARLILIRGIPGSGKSTLAKSMLSQEYGKHMEADMYFDREGEYKFDATKLGAAHGWCQAETAYYLDKGINVVVSNTFTTIKELKPYFEMAKLRSITPEVILCQNQFGNIHNVPAESLKRMQDRFQYDIGELFNE
jgi:predicted kinase